MPSRTPQTLWDTALGQLELQVTRPNFETWLRPTTALRLEGAQLVVGVPTDFALEWLRSRLASIVNRTVSRLLDQQVTVLFEVLGAQSAGRPPEAAPRGDTRRALVGHLDANLTFESFIPLKCNRVAYRAAKRALGEEAYGVLVISGQGGSGKTHLLHATGNAARRAGRSVVALSGEAFVDRYASAVRHGQPHSFREAFGECELFLLDDLRFLSTRTSSQEQFLLALDELRQRDCAFVVTTDAAPDRIAGLSDRLLMRLRSGVFAELSAPSPAEKIEFLQALAGQRKQTLPAAVLTFIAERHSASLRDVAGAFQQVIAYAELSGQAVTPGLAQEALRGSGRMPGSLTPEQIIDTICERFSVSREQIAGRSRARAVTYPRHLAMYLLREKATCSLAQIGQLLGGRDHSTVLSGYARIKQERAALPQTKDDLDQLEASLQHPAA
ncbi:MAG: DnaA ATPase domain-containing protein [Steroidobacteraceae bacterium]